ncbi:MAG TPA: metalloregulator ArsR/SmtB family transcription factor [Acidimicrobiales bacterium]|nr:metalloregulator ArsR/SmtB family transcription factor [Acidimicrobiales bacterium]
MARRSPAAPTEPATASCCPSVLATPLDAQGADTLAGGFHALADPVRLRVLSMLASAPEGEVCVCEFVGPLGKSQPTVSHHLKILSDAGLVHGQRRGKWVWYSLDRPRLAELQGALADPDRYDRKSRSGS